MPEKISLVEVFRSVQGEGYNAGRPALFVRTAGCNLSCVFAEGALCDTPYQHAKLRVTLDALFNDYVLPLAAGAPRYPPMEGAQDLVERDLYGQMMLVVTGGEPTLQPLFDVLVRRAWALGFYVALETNGTRWRNGMEFCHWLSVSPKGTVPQGSPAQWHNPHPQDPAVDPKVGLWLDRYATVPSGEYRYVIGGEHDPVPHYSAAFRHYLSPAVYSDGSGTEWQGGFPGFAPGAVERCLAISQEDPRWRISLQSQKFMRIR